MDEISIEQSALAKALSGLPGVSRGGESGILIDYAINEVAFTASNSVQQITRSIEAKVSGFGRVIVPAERFDAIVRSLSGEIKLEIGTESVVIKSGRSRYQLQASDAQRFPLIERQDGQAITVDQDFIDALSGVRHAMHKNEVFWNLMGVALHYRAGALEAFAMDGSQAAIWAIGPYEIPDVIIPSEAVDLILKSDNQKTINLEIAGNVIWLTMGNTTIATKRIDAEVQNYGRITNWEPDVTVEVNRKGMISSLARLLIAADDKDRAVTLVAEKGEATITNASGTEVISCKADDRIRIGFRASVLKGALEALSGEEVRMLFRGPNDAVMVLGEPREAIMIVNPYRIAPEEFVTEKVMETENVD